MRAPALLLATAGCVATGPVELPEPGAARAVLVLQLCEPAGCARILAAEAGAVPALGLDVGRDVFVLMLEDSLETLGLAPGPVSTCLDRACERPRPLPVDAMTDRFHRAHVELDGVTPFEPITALPRELDAIEIAGLSREACLSSGRCFAGASGPSGPALERLLRCVPCEDFPRFPGAVVDSPAPPAGPRIDCPSGWSVDRGEVTTCLPPELPPRITCPSGQVQLHAAASCTGIGGDCAEEWPKNTPAGTIHVRPGASPGGDGTAAAPLDTLEGALLAVGAGGTIAIGKGMLVSSACLAVDDVTLAGTCTRDTIISSTASCPNGVLQVGAGGARMLDLHVRGGVSSEDGLLVLDGVEITDGITRCVDVLSGVLEASRLVLRRCDGLRAEDSVVVASDLVVEDVSTSGVLLVSTQAELTRAAIRNANLGVLAGSRSVLSLQTSSIDTPGETGVLVVGGSAELDAVDIRDGAMSEAISILADGAGAAGAVVRDTSIGAVIGHGISVRALGRHRAELQLTRSAIRGAGGDGVGVASDSAVVRIDAVSIDGAPRGLVSRNSTVSASDLVVRGDALEHGLIMTNSLANVSRIFVRGARRDTIGAYEASSLSIADLTVHDPGEHALRVMQSEVTLDRAEATGIAGSGVALEEATANLHDVALTGVAGEQEGVGIFAASSVLTVERARISDLARGVHSRGAGATLYDLDVQRAGTEHEPAVSLNSRDYQLRDVSVGEAPSVGLELEGSGFVERIDVDGAAGSALLLRPELAEGPVVAYGIALRDAVRGVEVCGGAVDLGDLTVTDLRENSTGAVVLAQTTATITRFEITDTPGPAITLLSSCGFVVAPPTVSLRDGLIARNLFGLASDTPADLGHLARNVRLQDNGALVGPVPGL